MADIHPVALDGFDSDPQRYERSRPSYPAPAVDWLTRRLELGPGKILVDLAAGTGKLTRLLIPTGARVVAIEPVHGMRRVLSQVVPSAAVVAGIAEALPFPGASIDAITVAQAFHWFDRDAAFQEFARVLRPGGGIGLIWNVRDRSVPWLDEVWAIADRAETEAPWRTRPGGVPEPPGFGPVEQTSFRHVASSSLARMIDRVASVSHVAILPEADRERTLSEVREVIRRHGVAEADDDVLEVPYRADVYHWRRRG